MKNLSYFVIIFITMLCGCVEQVKPIPGECTTQSSLRGELNLEKSEPIECSDLSQYTCDLRDFSPNVNEHKKRNLEFCRSGSCLKYNIFSFDTSMMRDTDEFATEEDFKVGGQYNYQEANCKNKYLKSGESTQAQDLDQAIDQAIELCEMSRGANL